MNELNVSRIEIQLDGDYGNDLDAGLSLLSITENDEDRLGALNIDVAMRMVEAAQSVFEKAYPNAFVKTTTGLGEAFRVDTSEAVLFGEDAREEIMETLEDLCEKVDQCVQEAISDYQKHRVIHE